VTEVRKKHSRTTRCGRNRGSRTGARRRCKGSRKLNPYTIAWKPTRRAGWRRRVVYATSIAVVKQKLRKQRKSHGIPHKMVVRRSTANDLRHAEWQKGRRERMKKRALERRRECARG
jgi:hypothetical protein